MRIEREGTLPVHFEQLWLVYLAANIYGNADSALILMTHNRGREARWSVRSMYENLGLIAGIARVANPIESPTLSKQ